ncbi:MAG: DinB family protein [Symbiobacterium sp.]|uniref:DinB family protein n=1 Tax=Symbiobacterium sp. TaxID=1971213 RepID=UPI003464BE6F
MGNRPTRAIPVRDLEQSLRFYTERLGFRLVTRYPDAAHLETPAGHVLLAGPSAGDLANYLAPHGTAVRPGAVLYFFTPDLDATARGLPEAVLVRTDWGERKLELPDPDGYTVSFWTENDLTPEQALALFRSAPERLEAALEGLTEAQLDLARAPGKWSIRQIVHHMTDSAVGAIAGLRYAIAEPGRLYRPNPYSPDAWDEGLHSHRRPVGPSVALFRAVHEHLVQLIEYVPGALERYTVNEAGTKMTVGRMVGMLACHAAGHTEQIWETRRVHGI